MNYFQKAIHLLVVSTLLSTSCKKIETENTSETKDQSSQPANTSKTKSKPSKPTNNLANYDPQGSIESAPLSASQDQTKTDDKLFTRLAPAKTGVNFINPILKNNPRAYLYASAMGCGGISVGDINGDGTVSYTHLTLPTKA